MKSSHWLVALCFAVPVSACGSDNARSDNGAETGGGGGENQGTGGDDNTGGTNVSGGSGGTAHGNTGGAAGTPTNTGGSGGSTPTDEDCDQLPENQNASARCIECLNDQCGPACGAYAAVLKADINALSACMIECSERECIDACLTQYQHTIDTVSDYQECSYYCSNWCRGSGGPCGHLFSDAAPPTCSICMRDKCGDWCQSIWPTEIGELNLCYHRCTDDACVDTCENSHPMAVPFFDCYNNNCAEACYEPACRVSFDDPDFEKCVHEHCAYRCGGATPTALSNVLNCINACPEENLDECTNDCIAEKPVTATFIECIYDGTCN